MHADASEEFDETLHVLANELRRQILAKIAIEPHYPLQLASELGTTQQAVLKHLRVLEDAGFVARFEEASDAGGPPRTYYALARRASVRVDVLPSVFREEYVADERLVRAGRPKAALTRALQSARKARTRRERLARLSSLLKNIRKEHARLERVRRAILTLEDEARADAAGAISEATEDYDARFLLHALVDRGEATVTTLANELNFREAAVRELLQELGDIGLIRKTGRDKWQV